MKTIYPLALSLFLLVLAAPSSALAAKADGKKAKLIAKYDANKNGKLDPDEREALRKDFAKDKDGELKAYDTNTDGKLDDKEVDAIQPGASKDGTAKKAKTDDKKADEKKPDEKKPEEKKSK